MAEQKDHASISSSNEGFEYHTTTTTNVALEMSELKEALDNDEEVQNGHINHQYYDTGTLELFADVLGSEDTGRCETILHKKGLTQEEMMKMTSLESPKLREIHEKLRTNNEDEEKYPETDQVLSLGAAHSQPREATFTSQHIDSYFVEIEQFFELNKEKNDKLLNEFKQCQYRKILLQDDVCKAFGQNDDQTIIGDILSDLGIDKVQRQKIYGRMYVV